MKVLADPKISVIIPTYNRKNELQSLLHSLSSQTFPADHCEIIVVDDGSTDGTREWLLEHKDQFKLPISLYSQMRVGPGAARCERFQ